MKEFDEYESLIKKISEYAIKNNISSEIEYISKIYRSANEEIKQAINKAIELRTELGYLDKEVANLHVLLGAGSQLYSNFENIDVAFCVSYDICCYVNQKSLIKECEKYKDNNSIFLTYPNLRNLISCNKELIDISKINNSQTSRILKNEDMIIKISDRINPKLIHYLKSKYPNNQLFVRIDKENYGENTHEFIYESVMRSEQSNWYKNMRIYNGENRIGHYTYPETIIDLGFTKVEADSIIKKMSENGFEETNKYILQTFFKRDNNNLLSGSIEEMKTLKSDNTLVSKHIHLTSVSEVGTDWEEGILAHIDGAINVYFGDNAKKRLSKNLDEKVKADCRTHLFRIDNIPITELLPIAKLFFKGLALVEEWENDSFRND